MTCVFLLTLEPSSVHLTEVRTAVSYTPFLIWGPSSRFISPGDFTCAWLTSFLLPGFLAAMETEDGSRGEEQDNQNLPVDPCNGDEQSFEIPGPDEIA